MATHGSRWYLMRSDGILCQASLVGTHKSVFGSSGNLQNNIQAKDLSTFDSKDETACMRLCTCMCKCKSENNSTTCSEAEVGFGDCNADIDVDQDGAGEGHAGAKG